VQESTRLPAVNIRRKRRGKTTESEGENVRCGQQEQEQAIIRTGLKLLLSTSRVSAREQSEQGMGTTGGKKREKARSEGG